MKTIKTDLIRRRKRRIQRRLRDSSRHDRGTPMIAGANTRYELAEKAGGTAYGGIAAIHSLVRKLNLPERIEGIGWGTGCAQGETLPLTLQHAT